MAGKLNREAYEKLIREDIKWLKSMCPGGRFDDGTPHSLEARHIIDMLERSVAYLYELHPEVARAVAEEREAAARVAEELSGCSGVTIADAIRARGTKEES